MTTEERGTGELGTGELGTGEAPVTRAAATAGHKVSALDLAQESYAAINVRDTTGLRELFSPDILRHATAQAGIELAVRAVEDALTATPDLQFVVEDAFGDGDRAAIRVSVHGRGGSPSTILEIFRSENGRVVEIWGAGAPAPPARREVE